MQLRIEVTDFMACPLSKILHALNQEVRLDYANATVVKASANKRLNCTTRGLSPTNKGKKYWSLEHRRAFLALDPRGTIADASTMYCTICPHTPRISLDSPRRAKPQSKKNSASYKKPGSIGVYYMHAWYKHVKTQKHLKAEEAEIKAGNLNPGLRRATPVPKEKLDDSSDFFPSPYAFDAPIEAECTCIVSSKRCKHGPGVWCGAKCSLIYCWRHRHIERV